jgi:iron-sulfur cluster assembly protein
MERILITDEAMTELRRLKDEQDKPYLRIQVIGGGCSGMSYKLEFTDEVNSKDKVFHFADLTVLVDVRSMLFIDGLKIDFSSGLNDSGFKYLNPNAKRTCGCGSSFS